MLKRVVIADDEPIVRADLFYLLKDLGFSVEGEAADGFDAVELCRRVRPDLVLMDIKMPVFDGLGAADAILKEDIAGCVVMLTALCDQQFIDRANLVGVTGYLVKPIDKRLLLPTIEVAYSQSQRLKQSRLEAEQAKRKLKESRLIERAKLLIGKELGISEGDAYRELQRMSMNKRCSMLSLAETVIERNSQREIVNQAKRYMMDNDGLSENGAFKRLTSLSQTKKISMQQAAQYILSRESSKI
jgi:response regulator NasT